jgi:electron transfer DM13
VATWSDPVVIRSTRSATILPDMERLYDLGSSVLGAVATNPLVALAIGIALAVGLVVIARRRGWASRIRRHPRASIAIAVPLLAVALPVGWYLASPLVLSASIDEAPPIVAAASPSTRPASPSPSPVASGPSPAVPTPKATAPATAAPVLLTRTGSFQGTDDFHFGRGTARLIEVAPGSFVVRLEDFAVRNGPDLYVYLSPSATGYADGAIELGRLKADTGNQNYPVPPGALDDPGRAASVVIWCRQFSHLFATATLAA